MKIHKETPSFSIELKPIGKVIIDTEKGMIEPNYLVNHSYLLRFCLILSISASIQMGLALSENA